MAGTERRNHAGVKRKRKSEPKSLVQTVVVTALGIHGITAGLLVAVGLVLALHTKAIILPIPRA